MSGFHQYHATSLGESGLAATALAVHQLQQIFAENLIGKHIGQTNDGLLYGPNTFHDFSTLLKQHPEFVLRRAQNFLHVGATGQVAVFAATTTSIHDYPSRAKPSALPQHWLICIGTETGTHWIPQKFATAQLLYSANFLWMPPS
jgi:hypothetical protein